MFLKIYYAYIIKCDHHSLQQSFNYELPWFMLQLNDVASSACTHYDSKPKGRHNPSIFLYEKLKGVLLCNTAEILERIMSNCTRIKPSNMKLFVSKKIYYSSPPCTTMRYIHYQILQVSLFCLGLNLNSILRLRSLHMMQSHLNKWHL